MWVFEQKSGWITRSGIRLSLAYSGHPPHVNDPSAQQLIRLGPIPCGLYTIGHPIDTILHGPFFLPLTPDPDNEMFGRSDFGIHGDEILHPGQHLASEGCIITDRISRQTIWGSGDTLLKVISYAEVL